MVKAEEGLEVVDDAGRTGPCPLIIRLKVPKDQSVERGSPGGRGGSKTVTFEDLLPECVICGKRFQSEKAVHGHMRVHVIGQRESVEKESRELSPRRDVLPSTTSVGEKTSPECRVCRKTFPSRKSLHGHMRSHPDRTWRGVHPPAEGLFSGWSVTGKRGRQFSDSVSSGGLDLASKEIVSSTHKETDRVKEALRFMAMNDKEYLKLSQHDEKVSVAGGSDENEKDAGVKDEIKMPQEEKPLLDVPGIKAEEAELSLSRGKPGKPSDCAPANNYTCSRCQKSFSRYQSLGGHRSSCNMSERRTTAYQAAQTWSKLPWLDLSLSLSPPNSSPSNLGHETGGIRSHGTESDRVPLELDMIFKNSILLSFI